MNESTHHIQNIMSSVVLWLCAVVPTPTHGDLVRLDFSGQINAVIAGDYTVGEPRAGAVIYNSDTQLTTFYLSSPFTGSFNGATQTFTLGSETIDSVTFNIASQIFWSNDDRQLDFDVQGFDSATGLYESLVFSIRGPDTFANTLMLTPEPNVASRASASFTYSRYPSGGGAAEALYGGLADKISVTIVPEPATGLLLISSGLLFLKLRSRRRKWRRTVDRAGPLVVP